MNPAFAINPICYDSSLIARWENFADSLALRECPLSDAFVLAYCGTLQPVVHDTIRDLPRSSGRALIKIVERLEAVAGDDRGSVVGAVESMSKDELRALVARLLEIGHQVCSYGVPPVE